MADRLQFQLDLTGEMAAALRPVVGELAKADDGLTQLRLDASQLDAAMRTLRGSQHERGFLELAKASVQQAQVLPRLRSELGALSDGGRRLRVEWGNAFSSFAGFRREINQSTGVSQWVWNAADGLGAIRSAATAAGAALLSVTKAMVKAIGEAEDLDVALKFSVGESASAQISQLADTFGNTRFDDDTIKRALIPLARAKVTDPALLSALATVASDVETLTAGETSVSEAGRIFGKIAAKRDVNERTLESLALNAEDFYARLGVTLGISAEAAKKQAGAGKVSADTLLREVVSALAEKQGGVIGAASLAGGETFGATLQRLSDLPGNVLKGARGTQGVKELQVALEDLIGTLKGDTGIAAVEGLASALGFLVNVTGAIVGTLRELPAVGEDIGDFFFEAHQQIGDFLRGALEAVTSLPGRMVDLGRAVVDGLVQGIKSAAGSVKDAITGLGGSMVDWFKGKLEIRSPSQVFSALGEDVGRGVVVGLDHSSDEVAEATRRLLESPSVAFQGATATVRAVSGSLASAPTFNFYITGGNAPEIGREVEERVRLVLARHYEAVT